MGSLILPVGTDMGTGTKAMMKVAIANFISVKNQRKGDGEREEGNLVQAILDPQEEPEAAGARVTLIVRAVERERSGH